MTPTPTPNLVEAAQKALLFMEHTSYATLGGVERAKEEIERLERALAALPTDAGPMVCVPRAWLESAAGHLHDYGRGDQAHNETAEEADGLAEKLRSVR